MTRSPRCSRPGSSRFPLLIQDRAFNDDGSIHFTQVGDNPDIHPYWDPEYFGDTIMVNGKVWPRLRVERRQYRFRIINASNARFYNLKLSNGMSFTQIGGDGSYLPAPATLTETLIAPAERQDILIDFSHVRGRERRSSCRTPRTSRSRAAIPPIRPRRVRSCDSTCRTRDRSLRAPCRPR